MQGALNDYSCVKAIVAGKRGSAPGRGVIPTLARTEWSLARSSGEVRAGCWAAMDVLR